MSDEARETTITALRDDLALRKRCLIPRIARCGIEPKNRLGCYDATGGWSNGRSSGSTASGA